MKTALQINVANRLGAALAASPRKLTAALTARSTSNFAGVAVRSASVATLAFALLASGCAGITRAPVDAFQAADIAIANAEKDQASDFAPNELIAARAKIANARTLVAKNPREKDVLRARQLAEAAQSDAEYASARARDGQAQAVNADLQKNNQTLREELQRTTGQPDGASSAADNGESP